MLRALYCIATLKALYAWLFANFSFNKKISFFLFVQKSITEQNIIYSVPWLLGMANSRA